MNNLHQKKILVRTHDIETLTLSLFSELDSFGPFRAALGFFQVRGTASRKHRSDCARGVRSTAKEQHVRSVRQSDVSFATIIVHDVGQCKVVDLLYHAAKQGAVRTSGCAEELSSSGLQHLYAADAGDDLDRWPLVGPDLDDNLRVSALFTAAPQHVFGSPRGALRAPNCGCDAFNSINALSKVVNQTPTQEAESSGLDHVS